MCVVLTIWQAAKKNGRGGLRCNQSTRGEGGIGKEAVDDDDDDDGKVALLLSTKKRRDGERRFWLSSSSKSCFG